MEVNEPAQNQKASRVDRTIRILTNPSEFYHEVDSINLRSGVGVVALMAALHAIAVYPFANVFYQIVPEQNVAFALIAMTPMFVQAFFIVSTWLFVGLVGHGLTTVLFDIEGSLKDTLAVVGIAYTPHVISAVIYAAALTYALLLQDVWVPSVEDPANLPAAMETVEAGKPYVYARILEIPVIGWVGVLSILGARKVHDIDLWQAAVGVGIPVVVVMLLWINQLP